MKRFIALIKRLLASIFSRSAQPPAKQSYRHYSAILGSDQL